jgi:hypothetical protein
MPPREDPLLLAINNLQAALSSHFADHEQSWSRGVAAALQRLGKALENDRSNLRESKDIIEEVNPTQLAPALDRRVQGLRGDGRDYLDEVRALQLLVEPQPPGGMRVSESETEVTLNSPARGTPDVRLLRERGEQLIAALRQHHEDKANLILEHVNTELGAGD